MLRGVILGYNTVDATLSGDAVPVTRTNRGCSARLRQHALLALLIGAAVPAMAATGIGSDCDSTPDEAAPGAMSEAVTIKRTAPTKSLRLRQADTVTSRTSTSDLVNLLPRSVSTSASSNRELRSAALADALERRQQQRSALGRNERTETAGPRVEADIPGVSEEEALVFRREMFRTDI